VYFVRGQAAHGFALQLTAANGESDTVSSAPAATGDGSLQVAALDYKAQEDARRLSWSAAGTATAALASSSPLDLDRQTNGDVMLVATLRIDALSPRGTTLGVACGKGCGAGVSIGSQLAALPRGQWLRVGIPLKCFRDAGADMGKLDRPFEWTSSRGESIVLTEVSLGTVADRTLACKVH
jgi:beta-glucosidase